MKKPDLEQVDKDVLEQARIVFMTVLEAIKAMEFPLDGRDEYIKEIESELDAVDVELLSRGDN
jgi:hypothetical protein